MNENLKRTPPRSYAAFDVIDVNAAPNIQPYWIYHRLKFETTGNPRQLFIEKINQGFIYFLRTLIIKASGYLVSGVSVEVSQAPFFHELFSAAELKARQLIPIPTGLPSTPGQFGLNNGGKGVVYSAAPSAVDQNAFGVNASAQGLTSLKKLNYFYPSGDALRVDFTTNLNASGTVYVDCICEGYYIPEKSLDYWKGSL